MKPGEVHAIMGPNGSGKSTLGNVLSGRDGYSVTNGSVAFKGQDLLELDVELRAREGLFLGFQYPVEIPGYRISNSFAPLSKPCAAIGENPSPRQQNF